MARARHDLIVALVAESGTEALYRENAEFHAAVDALAAMLPSMVRGVADDCAGRASLRAHLRARLKEGIVDAATLRRQLD